MFFVLANSADPDEICLLPSKSSVHDVFTESFGEFNKFYMKWSQV